MAALRETLALLVALAVASGAALLGMMVLGVLR
jgi:hypothetical protein